MNYTDALLALSNGDVDLLPGNQYTPERAESLVSAYSVGILLDHAYYSNLHSYTFPDSSYNFGFGISNYEDTILLSIVNKAIATITDTQRTNTLVENISKAKPEISLRDFIAKNEVTIFAILAAIALVIVLIVASNAQKIKKLNAKLRAEAKRADRSSATKATFFHE